jgi:glycolate oxidase iron-sulfur subunit
MLFELMDRGDGDVPFPSAEKLASLCLGCRRCQNACPQGVDAARAVAELRALHPGFRTWLWKNVLRKPRLFFPLAGLAPRGMTPKGLNLSGLEPPSEGPWVEIVAASTCFQGRKAVLFPGCAATSLIRRWRAKAENLLTALGVDLLSADFGCCGLPQESAGLLHEAKTSRARFVEQWRKLGRPLVATLCATCRRGLHQTAEELDEREADALREALTPLSAMLMQSQTRLTDAAPELVALHTPCHETSPADERWLAKSLEGRLVSPDTVECCGFGGALRLAQPDLAEQVGARCWSSLLGTGAQTAVTGCTACVLALATQAPPAARAFHWLDIFAQSFR